MLLSRFSYLSLMNIWAILATLSHVCTSVDTEMDQVQVEIIQTLGKLWENLVWPPWLGYTMYVFYIHSCRYDN